MDAGLNYGGDQLPLKTEKKFVSNLKIGYLTFFNADSDFTVFWQLNFYNLIPLTYLPL